MAEIPKNIGWIGLGLMGLPMAKNLVQKTDSQLFVYDVVKDNMDKAVELGQGRVHACESSKDVADKSDIIFSMVPEGSHVKSVYLDPTTGVFTSSLGTKVLIDCSTIDTASSSAVRAAVAEQHREARFYDAPVSGGVIGAEKASLTFMLGAPSSSPDTVLLQTLLKFMGGNIFICGGPGLGLTAKMCNNYCSGLIAIAVSEALNTGIRSGLDPRVLANIFHTSTAQSAICDDWNPVPGLCPEAPASKNYEGGFRVELMRKDFALAVNAAERVGARLALGREGLKVYDGAMADENCKRKDSRVVYRYLGGDEDWRGKFGGEVGMVRDETRKALKKGREVLKEEEAKE